MVITVDFQTKQFNIEILDIWISYDQLLQPWICSSEGFPWRSEGINVAETRWEESFEVSWTETCRDTIWWGWLRKKGTGDKWIEMIDAFIFLFALMAEEFDV